MHKTLVKRGSAIALVAEPQMHRPLARDGFRPHFSSNTVGRWPHAIGPQKAAQSCPQASLTSWRAMRLVMTSTRPEAAALPELTSPAAFGCTTHTSHAAVAKLASKKG